jgi:tetratricopeptide (TPR) repeat protein
VRFADPDLETLARHAQGRTLLRSGDTREGTRLLDEAMVAVTAGETSAMLTGTVYCSVIEACREVFDVRRAQEWTTALSEWCAAQPDLVPYRGQCLVHRSQLCQLHGDWPQAQEEVEQARARLSDPPGQPALGMAYYQQAELQRLRGELQAAEGAYHTANEHGHSPQPGMALLRLAQGRVEAAVAAIRHAVDEADGDRLARAALLTAYVEIMLAAGDVTAARGGADMLAAFAEELAAPLLEASAVHALGAVLLAEGDVQAALTTLRRAWTRWRPADAAAARRSSSPGRWPRHRRQATTLVPGRGGCAAAGSRPGPQRRCMRPAAWCHVGYGPRGWPLLRRRGRSSPSDAIVSYRAVGEIRLDRQPTVLATACRLIRHRQIVDG